MSHSELSRALQTAEVAITGTRFCSVCRKHRPADGFVSIVTTNRSRRWACATCVENKRAGRKVQR